MSMNQTVDFVPLAALRTIAKLFAGECAASARIFGRPGLRVSYRWTARPTPIANAGSFRKPGAVGSQARDGAGGRAIVDIRIHKSTMIPGAVRPYTARRSVWGAT